MEEIFKPSAVFPDCYDVSNYGNVKSYHGKGKILKPSKSKNGYLMVILSEYGASKGMSVHRLVALSFIGECPIGCAVNHKDGNKQNNLLTNLEYVTYSENSLHAIASGLQIHATGANHGSAKYPGRWKGGNRQTKISVDDVLDIRKQFSEGIDRRIIARQYDITPTYVSDIVIRKRWDHIL